MKNCTGCIIASTAVVLLATLAAGAGETSKARIPAFPGAEGAGMYTIGGRGGKVYTVTNLNSSGPGSLREACEAEGPRTVVFNVSGIIDLGDERLIIENPYITIAGQTAGGEGICITGNQFWINTSQVVVRYLRFRPAINHALVDALGGRPVSDIVIDHCSATWAGDENVSLFKGVDVHNDGNAPPAENLTVQWSLIGESMGFRRRPFGITWGGKNCSYHHNLHACNIAWHPYTAIADHPTTENVDIRNNVLYLWRKRPLAGNAGGTVNIVGNYFKPDPTIGAEDFLIADTGRLQDNQARAKGPGRWHIAGNYVEGNPAVTADNWTGVRADDPDRVRADEPFHYTAVTEHRPQELYELVLASAGASLKRDSVDRRIVDAVRNGRVYHGPLTPSPSGIPAEMFKLPEYAPAEPYVDSDGDGMPDWWEKKHGLDPHDPSDANGDLNGSGYTNLEEYLNGTDPTKYVDYSDPANNINTLR